MSELTNPFGLHTVTPYLVVPDVPAQIDFVENVLDGTLRGEVHKRDDGSIMHAEMTIGDSVVMMGEPVDNVKATAANLYVYVDDADARFQKALDYGAESMMEPTDMPHGDRYGGVKDSAGNVWWLATHVGKTDRAG